MHDGLCTLRERLLGECVRAEQDVEDAARRLTNRVRSSLPTDYEILKAELARAKARRTTAQAILNRHVTAHGCR